MAAKKAAPKKPATIYLHCKCEDCTHWEITSVETIDKYDEKVTLDTLICKACGLSFPIELGLPSRQTGIHWSPKEFYTL